MSIDRIGGSFIPECDECGDTLFPENTFMDAVESKKDAGWKSIKESGAWFDLCPDCYKQYLRREFR